MKPVAGTATPGTLSHRDSEPDRRFLAGIELFNRAEYFEAHEVWEELWNDCPAADRRFYQGLIQAAVAIYHFNRNNHAGAARLFHSGKRYMTSYGLVYQGLNIVTFWAAMEAHLAPALARPNARSGPRPVITLHPVTADPS
jgi:predicted metal-dependent hydrolase